MTVTLVPNPSAERPPCPVCGGGDTEDCKAGFFCLECAHVFAGTRQEWERWSLRRAARADEAAGRTPRHLRAVPSP